MKNLSLKPSFAISLDIVCMMGQLFKTFIFQDLWNMNHCLLASLGVSHPALEDIRASAAVYGFGCKLTGAGGGG